ncbi:uncharacterized protein LOC131854818 [Achroia grisella]|uniref:uncharacterized protein LOC131854818 n=1 Tax=Achroia grisella TaxID=688607 RepID=UPI0027D348EB|nr:uncharacterized protein LOC131854818 [Achroia grisella]XP_059061967.1 uncharacterized protein LOC131854818 [Achroia grisella]XP_059061968.1 uncharacterized protein LOC131854818 [Achroia grisella]
MPAHEAPCIELGSAPQTPSIAASPSPSEISSASSPEPPHIRATPLFRVLAMPPPEPPQPPGQDELERRLPGYRRIVIPRELTLIELLKQCSGAATDEEVLCIREAKLRVVAERVGLRRLHVLTPRLRSLTLDGSALSSLRELGIGLIHLKILSINRCGLTSLDGVWGLGALREMYACGNKIKDLQPLGALQKLHTLNLADNPIEESSRLWTLGVCGSLRRLTLSGTTAADSPHYRTRIASCLPMLMYLDDRPLHTDISYSTDDEFDPPSSYSDSDVEVEELAAVTQTSSGTPEPGPSSQFPKPLDLNPDGVNEASKSTTLRRRPATTECGGVRPTRQTLHARPKTAQDKTQQPLSKLQILNTLMDEEWRCSGSKLTSHEPVCGNLARALRRPSTARQTTEAELEKYLVEQSMEEAGRALAAEIPRAPRLEDWVKFKEVTGIEIDIDFNERPKEADAAAVIDRLDRIERETFERLGNRNTSTQADNINSLSSMPVMNCPMPVMNNHDLWRGIQDLPPIYDENTEIESLFIDVTRVDLLYGDTNTDLHGE